MHAGLHKLYHTNTHNPKLVCVCTVIRQKQGCYGAEEGYRVYKVGRQAECVKSYFYEVQK